MTAEPPRVTVPWPVAEAARLRQRSLDAYAAAQEYDQLAAQGGRWRPRWVGLARRCRRIGLRLRHEAMALSPAPLEVSAAAVAEARQARRCAMPGCRNHPRTRAAICPSCACLVAYCWDCRRVRPRERFYALSGPGGHCRDCGWVSNPARARLDPEEFRRIRARTAALASASPAAVLAREAAREAARPRRAAVVAAVQALGGPPGSAGRGFWPEVARRVGGISPHAARTAYATARRYGEVPVSAAD